MVEENEGRVGVLDLVLASFHLLGVVFGGGD